MGVFERWARAGPAILVAAAGIFPAGGAQAVTRYVDAAAGVNVGSCSSPGSPCKTITYAMSQAVAGDPGDTVSVAPGTYGVALGEAFPITFKNGVQLLGSGSPGAAVIDGTGITSRLGFLSSQGNTSPLARIEGFTFQYGTNFDLTGGCSTALGGALFISNATGKFTITRNLFFNNEARGYSPTGTVAANGCSAAGGAIYATSSVLEITNNAFAGNIARGGNGLSHAGALTNNENGGPSEAGALYVSGTGTIANNTFYGNRAIGGDGGTASNGAGNGGSGRGGAMLASTSGSLVIWNNIFVANTVTSGAGGAGAGPSSAGAIFASGGGPAIAYSLFFGNLVNGAPSGDDALGSPFVTADPLFHGAPSNLRIRPGSPAAGAGIAVVPSDYDGTVRPNPPSIGAFEVSPAATTTTIESSQNPSSTGQSVTFTATVSTASQDSIAGTVTFKEGAAELCSGVALAGGQAQCVVSSFSPGTHAITAEYPGDGTYAASTSPTLNQVVNTVGLAGTQTALTSNVNPSTVGQSVTFTAAVSTASLGVVTGAVTFREGATILCANVTLSNGLAVCASASLSAGNHAITAQYLGNGTYSGSTSPTLHQGVSGPGLTSTSTSLASSANPSVVSQSVTLTAIVAAATPGVVPGTVTFKEGGLVLCSNVPLASNRAQCPFSASSAGTHAVIAEYAGSGTYLASTSPVLDQVVNAPPSANPRLYGISTRANVLTGDNVIIGGFIIDGAVPKTVIMRARGPSLGIAGALANPTMTVVPAAGGAHLVNDDWQTAGNAAQIQSSGFAPGNPNEAAVLATLEPGAYTAIVSGVGGTTGVAIVEVYEIDQPNTPAIGISTRGLVQTQDRVMIGGFIIQGGQPLTVVVRARGPSLGVAGALNDPTLTIVPAAGGPNFVNDDWQNDTNALQLQSSGFAPPHPWESAMLLTLNPGAYTAIVSGSGGGTGLAIIEVYVVD